jgi:hypothetical protein
MPLSAEVCRVAYWSWASTLKLYCKMSGSYGCSTLWGMATSKSGSVKKNWNKNSLWTDHLCQSNSLARLHPPQGNCPTSFSGTSVGAGSPKGSLGIEMTRVSYKFVTIWLHWCWFTLGVNLTRVSYKFVQPVVVAQCGRERLSYFVEVGLRAQNAIWNFRVPCGIISNTFKVKIFFFLLPFFQSAWIILS